MTIASTIQLHGNRQNMKKRKSSIFVVVMSSCFLFFIFMPITSFALLVGFPLPGPDCKTPVPSYYHNEEGACTDIEVSSAWSHDGLSYYSAGQSLNSAGNQAFFNGGVLSSAYAPFTGTFFVRMHYCQVAEQKTKIQGQRCTLEGSYMSVDSTKKIEVSTKYPLGVSDYDFGGGVGPGPLPYPSSMCFTLVDTNGNEWGDANTFSSCVDANPLPDKPAVCYINYGSDLNVNFGTIERSKIALNPHSGDLGNVQKNTTVLCTRDADVTVKTKFSFTPVNINGNQVVSTGSDKMGVAIIYNGKVVTPADVFTETYSQGYTNINLEFEMIRQSGNDLGEIPTGEFSADAIMIMTMQ